MAISAVMSPRDTAIEETVDMSVAALSYARRGLKVFPLKPGAKTPATSDGFYAGTTDEERIRAWWDKTPSANIGISTGRVSGIIVLDVDVKKEKDGFHALSELSGGRIPETLEVTTPTGGKHYYFQHPHVEVRNSAGKLGEGLDVRGDGGYIVAPPSLINGKSYRWSNEAAEMAALPEWFPLDKPVAQKAKADKTFAAEGTRNEAIFKLACSLRGKGTIYEEAEIEVLAAAAACEPPLPEAEALRALDSAYEYPEKSGVPEDIRELNQKHAFVRIGGNYRILSEVYDPVLGVSDIAFSSTASFKDLYSNRLLDGKKLGEAWLLSPHRRQLESVVFAPGLETPGYYNLWRGFPMSSKEGDCSLYLDHIRDNIANGDAEVLRYLLAWMADVIQRPRDLPGVAVVLRGSKVPARECSLQSSGSSLVSTLSTLPTGSILPATSTTT